MDVHLQEKIKQFIENLSYYDAKQNMYTEKNEYSVVANICKKQDRNQPIEEILAKSGIIGVAWHIGGASGGNCWGGEAQYYTNENPKIKDIYLLDDILSELFPDLKYSQYREIMKMTPIHNENTGNYEYYGNRTDYCVKFIKIDELVKTFSTLELPINEEQLDLINTNFENKKVSKNKPKK